MIDKKRNVYGYDIVVAYDTEEDDIKSSRITASSQNGNGRFSPQQIMQLLGCKMGESTLLFLKNNNLHDAREGLRGVLVLIDSHIGLVVRSIGSFVLFQVILPVKIAGEVRIVDLTYENGHNGFFLQQIHGELVGSLTNRCRQQMKSYPYIEEGHLYMDTAGPHTFVTLALSAIPEETVNRFHSLQDNLCTRNQIVSAYVRKRRNSTKGNALYIVDDRSRVDLGANGNMFYIPVGKPYNSVSCPWEGSTQCPVELYHLQDFVIVSNEKARLISCLPNMTSSKWRETVLDLGRQSSSRDNIITTLIIPSVRWSLNVILVTGIMFEALSMRKPTCLQCLAKIGSVRMLFTYDDKKEALSRGVMISSWMLGDTQVSNTRVHYEYIEQYRKTFGTGYGSRPRSSCLDSINSYRDKRFSKRAHPSPFIHDDEIGEHQYYSQTKQKFCLLQMKIESILHTLTNDATEVAERANPFVVRVIDRLATKLIATSGQSLFSFFNGLHVDTCDRMNPNLKKILFQDYCAYSPRNTLSFHGLSFPTTCGYQHVWKDDYLQSKYQVTQHFVMPGIGVGVLLEDSICHHFMAGAFTHCTGLCILSEKQTDTVVCNNKDNIFRVFAWGNSVNANTAKGNLGRHNGLANHRTTQDANREAARHVDSNYTNRAKKKRIT